jgi:hypothetical protein
MNLGVIGFGSEGEKGKLGLAKLNIFRHDLILIVPENTVFKEFDLK